MITDLEMLRSLVRLRQAVMHGIEVLQSPSLYPNDKSLAPMPHPSRKFRVGDFIVQDLSLLTIGTPPDE